MPVGNEKFPPNEVILLGSNVNVNPDEVGVIEVMASHLVVSYDCYQLIGPDKLIAEKIN